jgi:Rap1a immunity proteins
MKARVLICLSIFCLSLHARGQGTVASSLTSLRLREYCGFVGTDQKKLSDEEYAHSLVCLFYVSGVLDGFQIGDSATKVCVPSGASLGELALVVSKYLDQHPEKLHNQPQYLVIDALHTSFPCSPDPAKK